MKKQSGVDIDLGNKCSKNAYRWAKKTFNLRNGRAGEPIEATDGSFSNVINFNGSRIGISSDGIGTKIELAERTKIYNTLGYDLLAMVVDDLAANGFEPTSISNIIDLDYLDYDVIDALMSGLYNACSESDVVITGGEIAELGNRMNGYGEGMHFNWCSTAIGILPDQLVEPVDGRHIKSGDTVILLKSRGFRSNGYSLVRRIMETKFGAEWHAAAYNDEITWGEKLLTPSIVYCNIINHLITNGVIPSGIAHITGGGLADNIARALKDNNLGAELDNIFAPPDFVKDVQKFGNVSEDQAYRIWNMGNGMAVIIDSSNADAALELIHSKEMDNRYNARKAGYVISDQKIIIQSKGKNPSRLEYNAEI